MCFFRGETASSFPSSQSSFESDAAATTLVHSRSKGTSTKISHVNILLTRTGPTIRQLPADSIPQRGVRRPTHPHVSILVRREVLTYYLCFNAASLGNGANTLSFLFLGKVFFLRDFFALATPQRNLRKSESINPKYPRRCDQIAMTTTLEAVC